MDDFLFALFDAFFAFVIQLRYNMHFLSFKIFVLETVLAMESDISVLFVDLVEDCLLFLVSDAIRFRGINGDLRGSEKSNNLLDLVVVQVDKYFFFFFPLVANTVETLKVLALQVFSVKGLC